jgi:hypothetical protein
VTQSRIPIDIGQQPLPPSKPPAKNVRSTVQPTATTRRKRGGPKIHHPLPPGLATLTLEHKDHIIFGEELNPKKNEPEGPFKVAIKVIVGSHIDGNYEEVDLRTLRSEQIRQFALNLGCSKIGSSSKFQCRKEIALRVELEAIYDQVNMPTVRSTANEKKTNSILRIINACFLPFNVEKLIALNDIKKRGDFEAASGGNPIKDFWIDISETVNDGEEEQIRIVLWSREGEDEHLNKLVREGRANLCDFNLQTHQTCRTIMADLMKCRHIIMASKKQSGSHDDDTWQYCNGKHLKPRVGVTMSEEAVYYFDKHCSQHTDIDRAYTDVLDEKLRSDSAEPPGNDAGDKKGGTSKLKEEFLKAIEKTNADAMEANKEAAKQRETLINLQKQELEENRTSALWAEYTKLSETYFNLKEKQTSAKLLKNVAKRVRAIEEKIDIGKEDSVVEEADLLPPIRSPRMDQSTRTTSPTRP